VIEEGKVHTSYGEGGIGGFGAAVTCVGTLAGTASETIGEGVTGFEAGGSGAKVEAEASESIDDTFEIGDGARGLILWGIVGAHCPEGSGTCWRMGDGRWLGTVEDAWLVVQSDVFHLPFPFSRLEASLVCELMGARTCETCDSVSTLIGSTSTLMSGSAIVTSSNWTTSFPFPLSWATGGAGAGGAETGAEMVVSCSIGSSLISGV
jgi:hypothetical protein